ncbi:MAG TPA: glycosyltransferase family 4 protein [Acidobacteriota bacterium]|nr:glycosyltransferase family 4 protein [Acidobacteriota bacterium]
MHFAFLFSRFKILSGAERLILKLSEAVLDKGHHITIVCNYFDPTCTPLLPKNARIRISGIRMDYFRNRYLNAAFDYFRSSALAPMVPKAVDAICCFGPALAIVPHLKKTHQAPILYFCYEPPRFLYTDRDLIRKQLKFAGIFAGPFFSLYRKRDQRLVHSVDAVLSNSHFGAQQIQKIYNLKANVITHGLDNYKSSEKRSDLRKQFGFQDDDIVVITVNYLHPRKRIDLFVDSIAIARKKNSHIKGLIVGDGPEKRRLKERADAHVHFTGFVPDDLLHHYYQSADIYLNTARLETFGLSVIEAAGNALPVVSVNEGGPCETVVHEQTGLLVKDDSNELAEGILKSAADMELRKRFGEAGKKFVNEKYSWEQGAQDFLNTLNSLKKT